MPLDALCLSALRRELSDQIVGARIEKIHQPASDEIVLTLRGQSGGMRLLLSASPARPRAQLTTVSRENPTQAPMFCMLLRKHLSGARLVGLHQPPWERILVFDLSVRDELGDMVNKQLILEAMGRHANLILVDHEGRIVDCLRRVSGDISAKRQILPGMFYQPPPSQGKYPPQPEACSTLTFPREMPMDRWLVDTFDGLSPLIARELAWELCGETDGCLGEFGPALLTKLFHLIADLENAEPYLLLRGGKAVDFSFRPILQYGPQTYLEKMESFSAMLDACYAQQEGSERIRQKGQDLLRTVSNARDRLRRKLGFQRKELADSEHREGLREKGDLITANLYRLSKGQTILETENFYDPQGAMIQVTLDPLLTPQQNAARYYKDYQKAKTAQERLTEQLAKGEGELHYLQSVLDNLSRAEGEGDLEEIRRELEEGGYLRSKKKGGRLKRPVAKPWEFISSGGLRISVGRNNSQNDQLTCKLASRSDIWFHVQGIHGAHVILWTMGQEPDVASLEEAAHLAAWFSQGREGNKIPVDYTPVKYVKKPAGAKPGMVIYNSYETAFVTPTAELVERLRATK